MRNLKTKFTKWYFNKGYIFGYDYRIVTMSYGDDIFPPIPLKMPKCIFVCPWYIKPLLFLFSPSVYCAEFANKYICDAFIEGMNSVKSIRLE